MVGMRRVGMAVAIAAASLSSVGVVSLVLAESSAATPICTDSWNTAVSGTWSDGTKGNNNVPPNSGDVACINLAGTYTVDLTSGASINTLELGGGATGTQTLNVDGSVGNSDLALAAASTVSSNGVLALVPANLGFADVSGAGLTVASGGTLSTALVASSQPAYIETPVTNQSGGTVTIGAADTRQDFGTLTTNSGAFTVASGGTLALSTGSSFTDAAGTLTVTGTLSETGGTFTQSGGTESGNPVALNTATLADSAGTGSFGFTGTSTLTGTIPSGQTVSVNGTIGNANLTVTGVTDSGTLAEVPANAGFANIVGSGAGLTVASGGTLSTALVASSQPAYIETPVTNQSGGTVTIGAADTRQDFGTLTTNSGAFTVASGGTLALSTGSSFTDAAGTLTVTGTLSETGGTFTQSGGTESGNPVALNTATLADSAGTGSFGFTGTSTLTGTIPSGQTVSVNGT